MTKEDKNKPNNRNQFPHKENGSNLGWIRILGFIFLILIAVTIFLLFRYPQILNGPMGIFIPIALFIFLFAGFYSLIISLKL